MPPSNEIDASKISGNASIETKEALADIPRFYGIYTGSAHKGPIFAEDVHKRMRVTEISIIKKAEEPSKLEGRVVQELIVEEDMLNGGGSVHGGCSAFLVDICSTMALIALEFEISRTMSRTVSQSLNVVYHSPAGLGDKLRIVNQTLTAGARAQSVRTEIWNATHHRLVASGTHVKMAPSPPPKANL
ncbi:hypothetical protein NMY22_g9241 [Coprinellus aureogranulatus]|nr:hypothetical protein NMY22_g9241 [Coprinellus aureogranulatus]